MDNMINSVVCGDCLEMLQQLSDKSVDIVITSPPYNTSMGRRIWQSNQKYHYDIPDIDRMTDKEYKEWIKNVFACVCKKIKDQGVVLINLSYSAEKPVLMYEVVCKLQTETALSLVDTIIWEKSNALPNNMSPNRMTRICEFVFVFCKKGFEKQFKANKSVISVDRKGVKKFNSYKNIIKAKNNDGTTPLNKATFSSDFVCELLERYSYSEDNIILDPFIGTGTTAVACLKKKRKFIGIELSQQQCDYATRRIALYE